MAAKGRILFHHLLPRPFSTSKPYRRKQEELHDQDFCDFDEALDKNLNEPYWLKGERIAQNVLDSLLLNHSKTYTLWCACIMPNQAHNLLSPLQHPPALDVILQNHKKFTALHCNRLSGREGRFWQRESYDRNNKEQPSF